MNNSSKLVPALLLAAVTMFLRAQVSMAPASAVKDLRSKMTSLAPGGATDVEAQIRQAVTVRTGQGNGVLLPVRYSAPYKRDTPVTDEGVQAHKMYCAVVQQVAGGQPSLLTTIGTEETADQECYGIKAIGTARERDASSLILIYDVGKLPRVSPYAVVLQWDETQHHYAVNRNGSNDIAEHLTTSTTIANVRRFLAQTQKR